MCTKGEIAPCISLKNRIPTHLHRQTSLCTELLWNVIYVQYVKMPNKTYQTQTWQRLYVCTLTLSLSLLITLLHSTLTGHYLLFRSLPSCKYALGVYLVSVLAYLRIWVLFVLVCEWTGVRHRIKICKREKWDLKALFEWHLALLLL